MKRPKRIHWKMSPPRSADVQYATGEEPGNNSRKNEGMEPKWKQCPVEDVTGDESEV